MIAVPPALPAALTIGQTACTAHGYGHGPDGTVIWLITRDRDGRYGLIWAEPGGSGGIWGSEAEIRQQFEALTQGGSQP